MWQNDGKMLNILVQYYLMLTVAGRENSAFVESDDQTVPNNKRLKNKEQGSIDR